ncbi:hypothetical protein M433DRAFT_6317 [Acidomyces richmondensis BFW]|nr:hypothetical protein M433DRAFT_6317 [Acidomyces richmondensis BFW]
MIHQNCDPPLADFLDAIRDVKIMRERVAHVTVEHEENQVARKFREDLGQSENLSHEAFEAVYQQDLPEAEEALINAEHKLEEMQVRCIDEGVDIAQYANALSDMVVDGDGPELDKSDLPVSPYSLAFAIPVITPNNFSLLALEAEINLLETGEGSAARTSDGANIGVISRKTLNSNSRIRNWIRDVDDGHGLYDDQLSPLQPHRARANSVSSLPTVSANRNFQDLNRLLHSSASHTGGQTSPYRRSKLLDMSVRSV